MKTTKLKNKVNTNGGYVCGGVGDKGCGKDAGIATTMRGIAYCQKCARRLREVKNV